MINTKMLFIFFLAFSFSAGCSGGKSPGTINENSRMDERLDREITGEVERGAAGTTCRETATLKATPAGLEISAPPGTKARITVGDKSRTQSASDTKTVIDRVFSAPWWVYVLCAMSIVGGIAAAYFLGSIPLGVLGAGFGIMLMALYVYAQMYSWIFLIVGLALLAGVGVAAWYAWQHGNAQADGDKTWDALKSVVDAIEKQAKDIQEKIKSAVAANTEAAGNATSVKDRITEVKREG